MYHLVRPFRSYARRLFSAASFPRVSPTYCKRKSPISNGFSAKTPLPMRLETLLTLKPSWSKPFLIQKCAFSFGVNPRLRDLPFAMLALSIMRLLDSAMSSDLKTHHIMDLLWEKFQWILPLYMKPSSFQSKASVVCSVTVALFIDFCLKKLNVFSQQIGKKNKWISEFCRTNHQELKCWSTFCVYYFLRYNLMMQHQPIVKRLNGKHEWAHRPYQLLSAPYHCCLYKHRRQDERQPFQSSWPVPTCT